MNSIVSSGSDISGASLIFGLFVFILWNNLERYHLKENYIHHSIQWTLMRILYFRKNWNMNGENDFVCQTPQITCKHFVFKIDV